MIFIVIPVFNRKEFTYNCIKSLQQQTFKDFKIILVDDGSTDGTEELISQEFSDVIILKGNGNLWWAGATNLGVKYALANSKDVANDFLLTLNNDLEVPENYLQNIHAAAIANKDCLIGSVSVNYDNNEHLIFCGLKWNEFWAKQRKTAKDFNYSFRQFKNAGKIINSDLLSGRGTLIPLALFNEIDLYDFDNFPQYAADDDFSLRARKNGYKLIVHPEVILYSHVGETGTNLENVQWNFKYIKTLFFSIKSPVNLKVRYRFAIKNMKYGFLYFIIDVSRIFIALLRNFIFKIIHKKSRVNAV